MYDLRTRCPICSKIYVPDLAREEGFVEKWMAWQGIDNRPKTLIQKVWPNASTTQREQLQTGVCDSTCWDAAMRPCDED